MPVKLVVLPTDVYFACVNHALSTEREEIVGLLVGEADKKIVHISAIVILRRSDKRKDRVEISPEQLSYASTEAERLAFILKRPVRVVGWYHSHPKLNVWPSTIDCNTQDSYQMMDVGFIGLIFSVFNESTSKKGGRIEMTCFQSQTVYDGTHFEKTRLDIPVQISCTNCVSQVCMNALTQLPRSLCQEEKLAYQLTSQTQLEYMTKVYNSSVYLRAMGQISEIICSPLIKSLEDRIISNDLKRKVLQARKKQLETILQQIEKENISIMDSENTVPFVSTENSNKVSATHITPKTFTDVPGNNKVSEVIYKLERGVTKEVQSRNMPLAESCQKHTIPSGETNSSATQCDNTKHLHPENPSNTNESNKISSEEISIMKDTPPPSPKF